MNPFSVYKLVIWTLITFAIQATAAEKLCTVVSGDSDSSFKGYQMRVSITQRKLTVRPYPSNHGSYLLLGDFDQNLGTRDHGGESQIGFSGYDEENGVEIWVSQALLQPATSGHMSFRSIGEGTLHLQLECVDAPGVDLSKIRELMNPAKQEPNNCVNPGGSCDGTVPCCDPYNNACFRRRCQPIAR